MKWFLDSVGTVLMTIMLLFILHMLAAVLNITLTDLMLGIVCYMWAYFTLHKMEDK